MSQHNFIEFSYAKRDISFLWDKLFTTQIDVGFPVEVPYLYRSSHWDSAKRVIDLGTGNGHFLLRISKLFPKKKYVGVDKSRKFIDFAGRASSREKITFICQDIFKIRQNSFDYAIMRALVQHMDDYDTLLAKVGKILQPHGAVLVIELSDKDPIFFQPNAPIMSKLYREIGVRQRASRPKGMRSLDDFKRFAVTSGEWEVSIDEEVFIPSTIGQNQKLYNKQLILVIEIMNSLELLHNFQTNYEELSSEWRAWSKLTPAYMHMKLRIIELLRAR